MLCKLVFTFNSVDDDYSILMETKARYFPLVLFICFKKSFLLLNMRGRNPIVDHSNKNIEQKLCMVLFKISPWCGANLNLRMNP